MDIIILYFGLFFCGLVTGLVLLSTDKMTQMTVPVQRQKLQDLIKVFIFRAVSENFIYRLKWQWRQDFPNQITRMIRATGAIQLVRSGLNILW